MRPALAKPFSMRLAADPADLAIVVDPRMRLLAGHEMATLRRLANEAIASTQDDAATFDIEGQRFDVEWDDGRGNVPVLVLTIASRERDDAVAAQARAEGPVPDLVKIAEAALFLLKRRAAHAARVAEGPTETTSGLTPAQLGLLMYIADLRHLTARPFQHRGDRVQIGHDRHLATSAGPLGANLAAMVAGDPATLAAMGLATSPFKRRGGLVEGRRDPRIGVFEDSEHAVLDAVAGGYVQMAEDELREVAMRGLVAWRTARREARLPVDGTPAPGDAVHGAPAVDILADAARWNGDDDESIAYARERLARHRYDR